MQSQRSSTFLKLLQVTAARMPVWYPTNEEQPPQLCGAIEALSSYVAKVYRSYLNINLHWYNQNELFYRVVIWWQL